MKARFYCIFRLLSIAALLLSASVRSSAAHDLPPQRQFDRSFTLGCFLTDDELIDQQPSLGETYHRVARVDLSLLLETSTCPLARGYRTLRGWTDRYAADLGKTFRRLQSVAARPATAVEESLLVARPEDGRPPRPAGRRLALAQRVPKIFLEDYMPYDFNIQDWRFRQYPATRPTILPNRQPKYHEAHASVPSDSNLLHRNLEVLTAQGEVALEADFAAFADFPPAASGPSREAVALGQILKAVEDWQCAYASVTFDHRQRLVASKSGSTENPGRPVALKPMFIEPQFVQFEFESGERVVLTIAQAQQWSIVPEDGQATLDDLLRSYVRPVADRALNGLRLQFEKVGPAMELFAQACESLSAASKVADSGPSDLR